MGPLFTGLFLCNVDFFSKICSIWIICILLSLLTCCLITKIQLLVNNIKNKMSWRNRETSKLNTTKLFKILSEIKSNKEAVVFNFHNKLNSSIFMMAHGFKYFMATFACLSIFMMSCLHSFELDILSIHSYN